MRMNDIRLPICALAILASLVAGCDYDGDGFRDGLFGGGPRDCDGHDPNIHPGATEVCDGVDNDCDDEIDEHGLRIWVDDDRDGFGGEDHRYVCSLAIPSGFAVASGDCDDTVAAIRPWAAEICDGVDNDCDGSIDEGDLEAWYPDDDGDGYGRDDDPLRSCLRPDGHTEVGGDCDDADDGIRPDLLTDDCARPRIDANCNGVLDCASPFPWLQIEDAPASFVGLRRTNERITAVTRFRANPDAAARLLLAAEGGDDLGAYTRIDVYDPPAIGEGVTPGDSLATIRLDDASVIDVVEIVDIDDDGLSDLALLARLDGEPHIVWIGGLVPGAPTSPGRGVVVATHRTESAGWHGLRLFGDGETPASRLFIVAERDGGALLVTDADEPNLGDAEEVIALDPRAWVGPAFVGPAELTGDDEVDVAHLALDPGSDRVALHVLAGPLSSAMTSNAVRDWAPGVGGETTLAAIGDLDADGATDLGLVRPGEFGPSIDVILGLEEYAASVATTITGMRGDGETAVSGASGLVVVSAEDPGGPPGSRAVFVVGVEAGPTDGHRASLLDAALVAYALPAGLGVGHELRSVGDLDGDGVDSVWISGGQSGLGGYLLRIAAP